jgi:predicted phosphohydrolase
MMSAQSSSAAISRCVHTAWAKLTHYPPLSQSGTTGPTHRILTMTYGRAMTTFSFSEQRA